MKNNLTRIGNDLFNKNGNDYKFQKEINIHNESNPNDIIFSNNITKDSFTNGILDNTFIVFQSFDNIFYLIYSKRRSIISYDLIKNKKINEIKNAHNEDISNFRYYSDNQNKNNLIISISKIDNNITLWNIDKLECLFNIKNLNEDGLLYSACFLNEKDQIYIISSNWCASNSDPIKVFDLKGNKIKEINNSNDKTYYIDTYYDNKLKINFIINSNKNYIKSYDFNKNNIYHKYFDNDNNDHSNIIIYDKENLIQIIESSTDGIIRVWDFHSAELLREIKIRIINYGIYSICLWNNEYIFASFEDKTIKLINLKNGKIIKSLFGNNETIFTIKKIIHPKYGECIISQGRRYEQIKLWIKKK